MRGIVFNGKFRSQSRTGVQRVAQELVGAIAALKTAKDETVAQLNFGLALPRGATSIKAPGVLPVTGAKLKGVPWEQLELPRMVGHELLVNLCNVGPVSRKGDVVMIHDAQAFISPESYTPAFRRYYQTVVPLVAKRAAKVLTVSEFARRSISDAKIAAYDDITVLQNGVDHVLKIKPDKSAVEILGLTSRPYVVGLSSVQSHKNIAVILEAARHFRQKDLTLVLYGSSGRSDFEDAGIQAPSNVIFAGRVNDERMRALIEGARAYVFPSRTEGFGLPPLEAMLLGTPAIVAPCGALPELCGESVIYADESDPKAWAEAINGLVEDDHAREAYAVAGRDRAGQYQWSKTAKSLAAILRPLV